MGRSTSLAGVQSGLCLAGTSQFSVPYGSAISLHALCRNSYQNACILRDMKTYMPVLEIRFLECRGEPVYPDFGCQPSLALNLQLVWHLCLFLSHWLLFGIHWWEG